MEVNLDIYNSLLENFGNKIWIKCNKIFLTKIFCGAKVKSLDKRCLKYYRHPNLEYIYVLCKKLNISKGELYSAIKYFKYGKQGKWVKVNRNLILNEDVTYFLGLFAGEGTKSMSKQLQISNTDIQILKFVKYFYFRILKVSEKHIKAYIGIPETIKKFNINKFESLFQIPKNNIHFRYELHRRKIKVSLSASSGIYRLIIECLLKKLPSIVKNNNLGLSFIRGLSDGEGCVSDSGNRITFIISMNNSYFLDIAEFILLKYGCKTRREWSRNKKSTKDRLIIHARDFDKLTRLKIFRFRKKSSDKLANLNKNIKRHYSVKGKMMNEFINTIFTLKQKSIKPDTKEICSFSGLSESHVAFLMKISEQNGLLKRIRQRQNEPYECLLTDSGKSFGQKFIQERCEKLNLLYKRISDANGKIYIDS